MLLFSKPWRLHFRAKRNLLLLVFLFLLCCIINDWRNFNTLTQITMYTHGTFKKPLSIKTYKALRLAEHQFKTLLRATDKKELKTLESLFHRDLNFNWNNKYGLIPPSKPVFYKQCLRYLDLEYTERVSVVISFKDELLSILLRTLTTLVYRTPSHLLHEIILVDDGSRENNKESVLQHIQYLDVQLVWYRRENSLGIANARQFGIAQASGELVAVLDSHMVVSEMWLQPLIATLREKPAGIAVPLVQMIMDDEYDKFHLLKINPYSWKMIRGYQGLDFTDIHLNKTDETAPYPTPVIGGGALLAQRKTLLSLWPRQVHSGSWGVENLRLSLRAWACGGGLWVSVCGKVTHPNGLDPNLSRYNVNDPELKKFRLSETAGEIINIMKNKADADRLIQATYFNSLRESIFSTAETISRSFNYTKCEHDYDWYLKNVHRNYHFKYFDDARFKHVGVFQSSAEPERCLVNILFNHEVRTDTRCNDIVSQREDLRKNVDVSDPHLMGISSFPKGVVISTDTYYSPACWDAHNRYHIY